MSFARLVRQIVGDFRFERSYPSVVVQANDDDTVDLLPDNPTMRGNGLQRVPLPTIDPETKLRIEPGTRCLLSFRDGDPRKPAVSSWEYSQGSATVFLAGGVAAVARKGDAIDVMLSPSTPVSGTFTGTVTTPGSPPTVTPLVNVPFTGFATIAVPVRAVIVGGASRTKA